MDLLVNAIGPVVMADERHATPNTIQPFRGVASRVRVATSAEVKALNHALTVPMAEGRLRGHLAHHNRIHQLLATRAENEPTRLASRSELNEPSRAEPSRADAQPLSEPARLLNEPNEPSRAEPSRKSGS